MKPFHYGAACAALVTFALVECSLSSVMAAGACDATIASAKTGCDFQVNSDYEYKVGVCTNFGMAAERTRCLNDATKARTAASRLCFQQLNARDGVCDAVGQAPYDPIIVPADFSTTIDNPLFPLKPGSTWVYSNGDSEVNVQVTTRTIKVAGVNCVVVRDVNRVDGKVEEFTFDYFAQHKDGSVWYFGEDTISYHDGIASTKGSWRAGVEGAKAGIIMPRRPQIGKTHRLEFRLGVAEDLARNMATGQHVAVPFGTFNNALKTREYTPIEPGKLEDKYYVPGIGNVLVVDVESGEREELISFTPGS